MKKLFIVLFLILACLSLAKENDKTSNKLINGKDFEGVIFSAQEASAQQVPHPYSTLPEFYWTPTKKQVRNFEKQLESYLDERVANNYPEILENLTGYIRQYAGLVIEDRHIIFASFFCEVWDDNWQDYYQLVMDGGSCFFEIEYDTDSKEFLSIYVHGEA